MDCAVEFIHHTLTFPATRFMGQAKATITFV